MDTLKRQQQARVLRQVRVAHRWTGLLLGAIMAVIAVTGGLLGWKKHSGGLLLAPTARGTSATLSEWLPLDTLHQIATRYMQDSVLSGQPANTDRMDVRPDRGVIKFTFKGHYWGLQLDGATGEIVMVERRRADFIEHLHDGSILDLQAGFSGGWFKLIYTTLSSLALLTFVLTGFWLWYGPRRMRRKG